MRGITWQITLMALAVCPGLLFAADETKDDKARLQGSWILVSLEINGERNTEEQYREARLTIEGERYSAIFGERTVSETFKLDPSQTPRAIDFTYTDGPRKGETVRGIYKLEEDRYVMCRALKAEDARPKTFATSADSGLFLVVWRRVTPDEEARRKEVVADRKQLEGEWIGMLGLRDGTPIVDDEPARVKLTIAGEKYTIDRGETTDFGTCEIDPTADPKAIDIHINSGEFKGQTWHGIYQIAGQGYRVCFAPGGKDRPTRFTSEPGSGHVLWVFTRPRP